METQVKLGLNRTGIAMSPFDIKEMVADDEALAPDGIELLEPLSAIRDVYLTQHSSLGTVPIPASLKGAWESGKSMLLGDHPQVLIDKLGERLAFERSGVRLYGALIAKCEALSHPLPDGTLDKLKHFQREEQAHFHLLADCLTELGADPTAQTPCADLAGVESAGLMQAITDARTSVLQSLHVILAAELIDNDGWDNLIKLANSLKHDDIAQKFTQAAQQEEEHLETIRRWYAAMTLAEAQGEPQARANQLQ